MVHRLESEDEAETQSDPSEVRRDMTDANAPMRVQLSRRKGWRMPPNTVKVDRTTRFGNPYQAGVDGDGDRAYLVKLFQDLMLSDASLRALVRSELRGKNLACWCPPGEPCHADVLLELANSAEAAV